ncbi:MAG: DNA polymerase III subunit alpha, partial [Candidatus Acetothermia bacterium]
MEFVHLHTHSEYSILDSTNTLDGLLNKAQEMNMEALALTDHGNIGGAVKFYKKAKERGIKPIIGCELYVAPGSRHDKKAEPNRASASPYYHLVVLAENNEGYRNLVTLSSRAHTEGFYYKPRVDRELLREHHRGLIALSACQSGEVPKALLQDDFEKAVQVADELHDLFGEGNFFIELQDQGVEGQRELNQDLRAVAEQLDLPLVATNDIHYLEKEDKLAHEVLLNIQANKKITDEDRRRYEGEEYYFKSAQEMENRFAEIPQALENTVSIAERCEVSLDFSSTYLPPFKIPDQFQGPGEYLRELVLEGAKERWGQIRPEIRDRLDHELDVIEEMGYPTYFLIVRDFINFARREGIPVGPGRGSAAASAVAYCLKITDVDPLEHGLLFERFLNPARVSMPDIDIDFCQEGRDKVINYVVDKYGEEQVAQIATFDTMAARSAIRDVARVLDIPYDLADTIAKTIPPRSSLSEALGRVDELQDIRELFPEQERRDQLRSALTKVDQLQEEYGNQGPIEILFEISMKLEGLMRNASTHAAGVVIAPDDLTDYTPLQRLSDEEIVTQFDMTDLEEIGLLKMDFLGLRNLTIIDRTFDLVEEKENRRLDLEQIPFEDESTFELLREGKTAGVFQLESTGMQGLLKRLEPEEFEDIIASNALYRPGPLESGMTDDYIERKHGRQETTYPYPELEPVLEETYGLPIYQEQIMKMAQTLAGFSLAEADTLRKAMGKKKRDVMAQMEQKFIDGCVQNGISRGNAEELFSDIDKFSRYGFNKAHSTAYAYISYWTAWLKANYSASYMASLLTSVGGNEDKVSKYVKECEEMGIRVLPPDVNESDRQFTPVGDDRIRFGLSAIKYVGKDTTREIIENRPEEGFPTFFDFCRSLSSRALNSEALESLIKVGALDCFGTRKYLLSRINEGLEVSNLLGNGKGSGQRSFFDQEANLNKSTKPREEMDEFSEGQLLRFEKELLGLFITGDPLQNHEQELNTFCNLDLCEVESLATGTRCWIGGRISDLSRVNTKNGKPMAFISIDDGTEEREIIVFPQVYEQYSSL